MISPTLTHLLKSPFWWLVYVAPMMGAALYIAIRALMPPSWHVLGGILLVGGFGFYNFVVIGISVSQSLETMLVRDDADWNGWHTAGLVKDSIGGFVGLLFSILLLTSHLEQNG